MKTLDIMKKKKSTPKMTAAGLAAVTALTFGISLSPSAQAAEIILRTAPPQPRREVIVQRPGPDERWVWQKGHWREYHHQYAWVPGRWIERPYRHASWVEPQWVQRPHRGWVYVQGHWNTKGRY
jgi:hypothetical protein